MAQYQTGDGRWLVGMVDGNSDYHGFLAWRDCVVQLTSSGATPQSVNYLNALRDYAMHHNALNEPIMPPNVNVWISNRGVTSAVEADDVSVEGNTFTIGGIKWTGSAWDYSNAGAGGGGSSGGGVLVVNASADEAGTTITLDKTWQEIQDAPFAIVKAELSGISFFYYVSTIEQAESGYYILCEVLNEPNESINLYTDSPAGYPIYHRD